MIVTTTQGKHRADRCEHGVFTTQWCQPCQTRKLAESSVAPLTCPCPDLAVHFFRKLAGACR